MIPSLSAQEPSTLHRGPRQIPTHSVSSWRPEARSAVDQSLDVLGVSGSLHLDLRGGAVDLVEALDARTRIRISHQRQRWAPRSIFESTRWPKLAAP